MASLKFTRTQTGRSAIARCASRGDHEARRMLRDKRHAALIAPPDGHWWRHVQEWIAEQDGDSATFERLKAKREAEHKASVAMIRKALG